MGDFAVTIVRPKSSVVGSFMVPSGTTISNALKIAKIDDVGQDEEIFLNGQKVGLDMELMAADEVKVLEKTTGSDDDADSEAYPGDQDVITVLPRSSGGNLNL